MSDDLSRRRERLPEVYTDGAAGTRPDVPPDFEALKCAALEAVLLARPCVYGLADDGQDGAEAVLNDVLADVELTLGQAGHAASTRWAATRWSWRRSCREELHLP